MNRKALLLAVSVLASVRLVLTGQEKPVPSVFTAGQAEAGHKAYENSCGKCHAYNLLGRKVDEGEPPVSSLPVQYQQFIHNAKHVPPLAGKDFLSRWGDKTAAQVIQRFQVTAGDKFFQFENMTDDTVVNITAYALQMSGAKPGPEPLTRSTSTIVNSLIP